MKPKCYTNSQFCDFPVFVLSFTGFGRYNARCKCYGTAFATTSFLQFYSAMEDNNQRDATMNKPVNPRSPGHTLGNHRPIRGRHAFTLVELLVVIAITAILVTMLLPSFTRARNMARIVACQANMHLQGNMVQQYGADCNDFLPSPNTPHGLTKTGASFYYGSAMSVFSDSAVTLGTACPSDPSGGNGASFPVNMGWFYWQGYTAPASASSRDPLPGMACPDAVTTRPNNLNPSGIKNNIQINSTLMVKLANNFISHDMTYVSAGLHPFDCAEGAQEWDTSYIFRGWRYFTDLAGNAKMVPRASNWKTSQVFAVDVKGSVNTYWSTWPPTSDVSSRMLNWNQAHGDAGMNLLYFDGHVAFGAPNLSTAGLVNQYSQSVPPYIYYVMKAMNTDAQTAFSQNQSSGGEVFGKATLWNYYDTGIK